ncbi:KH domain-containing RNA-binding protein QKI isoform X9 [Pelodiscus sinensis]|uniref:KH domain-containing RNA-binding protein QKI isoform X9 n=1 Tax=Pelodiscus sinensis TaxID=13735 RepID=UPI003F6B0BCF
MVGEMETKEKPKPSPDYLMQLMNDKKLMSSLPNFCGIFNHLERLLDEEISRVRKDMYNDTLNGSTEKRSAELPDAVGPIVQLQEKLYVPVKEYPDEEQNRGKPNWEHLNEDLHVLITVEDAQNRAEIKLKRAVEEVKKLLVPAAEGEDSLKKMQLMELAILNGTYRDANIKSPALAFSLAATAQAPRIITGPAPVLPPAALRTPTPAGPTIMPLIRQIQTAVMPNGTPHPTAAIVPPGPEAGLIYTPYEYPYTLAPATSILEYPIEPSGVLGAVATKVRRHDMRVHPYQRIVTADREGGHNRTWDGVCWLLFGSGAGPGQGQACLSPTAPPPRSHLSRHRQLTYDLLTSELFTQ